MSALDKSERKLGRGEDDDSAEDLQTHVKTARTADSPRQEKALVTEEAKDMERKLNERSRPSAPRGSSFKRVVDTKRDRLPDLSPVEKFRASSKGLVCSPLEGQPGAGPQHRSVPLAPSNEDVVAGRPAGQSFSQPFVQGELCGAEFPSSSPGFPLSQSQGVRPPSTTPGLAGVSTWACLGPDLQWNQRRNVHPDQLDRRSGGETGVDGSGNQRGSQAPSYVTSDQFDDMAAKLDTVVNAVSKFSQFQVRVI